MAKPKAKLSKVYNATLPIAALKPHPRNYKVHPDSQLSDLEASLERWSQVQAVVVHDQGDGSYHIIAGHGLIEAAGREGFQEIDVRVMGKDWPEEEASGYLVADNELGKKAEDDLETLASLLQEQSNAGYHLESLGSSQKELEALLEELAQANLGSQGREADDPSGGGDDFAAEPEEGQTRVQYGDLWACGPHRVLCGDSTNPEDVKRLMAGEQPFIMVTDPPYGVDYNANWRNEAADAGLLQHGASRVGEVLHDDRVDWTEAWNLFAGDVVYCWHADRHASSVQASLEAAGFEIRCQVIWAKSRFVISRGHYHWQHEPCWYAVRKGATAKWAGDRSQTTLWAINLDKNVEGGHSTQKPLECMARPIGNHGGVGDIVYDPFLGSGTTLIACERLGRRCYGLEISPAYCNVVLTRFTAETGLEPELLDRLEPAHVG